MSDDIVSKEDLNGVLDCLTLTKTSDETAILAAFASVNKVLDTYNLDWHGLWRQIMMSLVKETEDSLTNPTVETMLRLVISKVPSSKAGTGMWYGYRDQLAAKGYLSANQMEWLKKSYRGYCR